MSHLFIDDAFWFKNQFEKSKLIFPTAVSTVKDLARGLRCKVAFLPFGAPFSNVQM